MTSLLRVAGGIETPHVSTAQRQKYKEHSCFAIRQQTVAAAAAWSDGGRNLLCSVPDFPDRRFAVQLVPSRDTFFQALGTPGQQMQQDLHTLLEAYEPLLARIQRFLTDHDLDFSINV